MVTLVHTLVVLIRKLLAERGQGCIEQGVGIVRIVNAIAAIFFKIAPDPQGERLCFFVRACDRSVAFFSFAEQTGSHQGCSELFDLGFDVGDRTIDVEVLGIGVASLAGGDAGLEGMICAFTEVAGDAGVRGHAVVRRGGTLNGATTTNAQEHVALNAEVRIKARGRCVGTGDDSTSGVLGGEVGHVAACLVAVSA